MEPVKLAPALDILNHFMTVKMAAEYLNMTPRGINHAIEKGNLPAEEVRILDMQPFYLLRPDHLTAYKMSSHYRPRRRLR